MNYRSLVAYSASIVVFLIMILFGINERIIASLIVTFPAHPLYQLEAIGLCILDMVFVHVAISYWQGMRSQIYIRSKNKYYLGLASMLLKCNVYIIIRSLLFCVILQQDITLLMISALGFLVIVFFSCLCFEINKKRYSILISSGLWVVFRVCLTFFVN